MSNIDDFKRYISQKLELARDAYLIAKDEYALGKLSAYSEMHDFVLKHLAVQSMVESDKAAINDNTSVVDYQTVKQELANGIYHYRVVEDGLGRYEAQHLYTANVTKKAAWFPLNHEGGWAEPDALVTGRVQTHHPMTKREAERAITLAKRINGQPFLTLVRS